MEDKIDNDIVGVWMDMKTHLKNIDGIFDYSSSKNKCFNIFDRKKQKIFIVRTENNNIKWIKQHAHKSDGEEILFIINYSEAFKIENLTKKNLEPNEKNINLINNDLWYIINSEDSKGLNGNENEDYYLSENDILKFGKVKYIVKEIHIENKNYNNNAKNKFFNTNNICKEHKYCEFCKDLMVRFCNCKEFEHFNCIKDWINDRIIKRESKNKLVKSYYFSIFQCKEYIKRGCNEEKCVNENCCEKCNTYYPLYFKLNQNENPSEEDKEGQKKYIEFYEIKKPKNCDYLILESFPHLDKTSNSPKIEKDIHIIKLTEENINIGSGKNNDMIIHDISVCKMHSVIKYDKNKGKLLLKNKSKRAGSLVLIKDKNIDLSEKEKYFQVGKTFFSAKLIKKNEVKNLISDLKDDEDISIIEYKEE